MRVLPFLVLFLLPACATTTDELFTKANFSGDFTAVNARLEAENEIETGQPNCRDGMVLVCETSYTETCSCVPNHRFHDRYRDSLSRRGNKNRH